MILRLGVKLRVLRIRTLDSRLEIAGEVCISHISSCNTVTLDLTAGCYCSTFHLRSYNAIVLRRKT